MDTLWLQVEGPTELVYFQALVAHLGLSAAVTVGLGTSSDPWRMWQALRQASAQERWLVADVEARAGDALRTRHLAQVLRDVRENPGLNTHCALSYPTFEYWLMLHEEADPRHASTPARLQKRLVQHWGPTALKARLPVSRLIDEGRWRLALERARALPLPTDPLQAPPAWFRLGPSTTVPALVERLVALSARSTSCA